MSKDFFILGFVKQAELAGIVNNINKEALAECANLGYNALLNKEAYDLNLHIPTPEGGLAKSIMDHIPHLVATNTLGAGLGSLYSPQSNKELREELEYGETPSLGKTLKYLALPGYAGYRLAKENRLTNAYEKYLDENKQS